MRDDLLRSDLLWAVLGWSTRVGEGENSHSTKGTGLFERNKFPFPRPLQFPNHPPVQSSFVIYILDVVYFCLFTLVFVRLCFIYARTIADLFFFSTRFDIAFRNRRGVTISKLIKINIDSYHPCFFFFEEEEEDFSFPSPFFLADSPIAFFSIRVRIRQKFRTKVSSAEGRVNNRRDTSSSRRRSGFKVGEVSRLA